MNFLENSIKYTNEGQIELKVENSVNNPELICITISDTGIGIHPDY
jgi:signal transduction histidine kinase